MNFLTTLSSALFGGARVFACARSYTGSARGKKGYIGAKYRSGIFSINVTQIDRV